LIRWKGSILDKGRLLLCLEWFQCFDDQQLTTLSSIFDEEFANEVSISLIFIIPLVAVVFGFQEYFDQVMGAIRCIKRIKSLSNFSDISSSSSSSSSTGGSNNQSQHLMEKAQREAKGWWSKATSFLSSSLVPCHLTQIVDALASSSSSSSSTINQQFAFTDPLQSKNDRSSSSSSSSETAIYSHVIVFVLGTGSYVEYENVRSWMDQKNNSSSSSPQFIYGASEMKNGERFLMELSELGV